MMIPSAQRVGISDNKQKSKSVKMPSVIKVYKVHHPFPRVLSSPRNQIWGCCKIIRKCTIRVSLSPIPGTGKPGGLLSMGSHRVGHD